MPEFVLDMGSPEDARRFSALDAFTRGYVEAMFFTECESLTREDGWDPEVHSNLPADVSFADLDPKGLAAIINDCARFQEQYESLLAAAYDYAEEHGLDYDAESAGRDLWLTRNGHGVGFWDRGLGDIGERLSDVCGWGTAFDERWVELGDDGRVYCS